MCMHGGSTVSQQISSAAHRTVELEDIHLVHRGSRVGEGVTVLCWLGEAHLFTETMRGSKEGHLIFASRPNKHLNFNPLDCRPGA